MNLCLSKKVFSSDEVQNTLPHNMAPWHFEYCTLKEFEKRQVQEGLSDLPLKQVIRPSCERCLPTPRRKEHPCL